MQDVEPTVSQSSSKIVMTTATLCTPRPLRPNQHQRDPIALLRRQLGLTVILLATTITGMVTSVVQASRMEVSRQPAKESGKMLLMKSSLQEGARNDRLSPPSSRGSSTLVWAPTPPRHPQIPTFSRALPPTAGQTSNPRTPKSVTIKSKPLCSKVPNRQSLVTNRWKPSTRTSKWPPPAPMRTTPSTTKARNKT